MSKKISSFSVLVNGYWRDNWGAPFVIAFIVLLLVVALALSLSLSSVAGGLAVGAFCTLVFGVVLQIVSFARNRDRGCEEVV